MPATIATVIGARPQFVKAAVLSRAINERDELNEILIHTGQHFDDNMSGVFFRELEIPSPHFNLGISGGTHARMTAEMLIAIESVLMDIKPDLVLTFGDTNSTLAGALAAAKLNIPIAHVEAGLRSFNRTMPEEINRILADHVSSLLFCPTDLAVRNLKNEGVTTGVSLTGDVMFDAVKFARDTAYKGSSIIEDLSLEDTQFGLCTIHRSDATETRKRLQHLLNYVGEHSDGLTIVFPLHPRTGQAMERFGLRVPACMKVVEPVGYFDLQRLLGGAQMVFTDSGGLQKEAYFHRIPCVTLRDETEWVETIDAGWNRLWTNPHLASTRSEIAEYGTGHAATEILSKINTFLLT